jgi:hypothetical protein
MEDATKFLEFFRLASVQINAVDLLLRRNISWVSLFKFLGGATDRIQIILLSK